MSAISSPPSHRPALTGDTVLVVDDDAVSRILCESVVQSVGGKPFLAENGMQGRALLAEREYACAVLDLHLPDANGLDLLRAIKDRTPQTEVIVVTAHADVESAILALRLGSFDYILKPFEVRGFTHRLQAALERRRVMAEHARMQTMLGQAERMASVGTLAAGMAHEINNPLAYVISNVAFCAEELPRIREEFLSEESLRTRPDLTELPLRLQEIEDTVRDAREGAERVRLIVKDLRTFSRGDEEKVGPVDLHAILDSSIHMAWNEIRHRARLEKQYGDIPLIEGNEARLGQVFVNLLVNAAQAIPDGKMAQNEIRLTTLRQGDDVVVEVKDSGAGIPSEIKGRLFEPFFTTKPVGVGTGLGLSICHGIITGLGGKIDVESEPGKGSLFRILLRAAASEEEAVPAESSSPGRRGRILVIDDEPMIGVSVRRVLAAEHDVLALPHAREALDHVRAGDRFDLILCDLMMPEMSGMDLHGELVRLDPQQAGRVVFLTGGAFSPRARAFLDGVSNRRLEKPFEPQSLRSLAREFVS